jgi:hypothetical protein
MCGKALSNSFLYVFKKILSKLDHYIQFNCKLVLLLTKLFNQKIITMKKLVVFCLLLAFITLESCKKNESIKEVETTKAEEEKPISVACYQALYESDTIELKVNTLKDGQVTGEMVMQIIDMPKKVGEIAGKFSGDTLLVDYTFYQGANEKTIFKNPMALLKKGNELILGSGKIETYLGRSYFAKDTPIDYEKVKYKFTTVDCAAK